MILKSDGPSPLLKLTDFGISVDRDDTTETTIRQGVGTPTFSAPEQRATQGCTIKNRVSQKASSKSSEHRRKFSFSSSERTWNSTQYRFLFDQFALKLTKWHSETFYEVEIRIQIYCTCEKILMFAHVI